MSNKSPKINITLKTCISNALTATNSTDSGSTVASNDDLLTQILRRLPVTSVLRFKSVSKHWHSLLSHPRFTLSYDNNTSASPGLFVRDLYIPFNEQNPTQLPFRSLDFYPDRYGIRIIQSCNGLLLCCSYRGKEHTRKYYVFNPTTKQFAIIPSIIGGPDARKTTRFMGLAFHRTRCAHYKLVCFRNTDRYGNQFQIQIYSSQTGKWRIPQQSLLSYDASLSYGAYSNGSVYWIPNFSELIYFNLDVEQVQKMLLPGRKSSSSGGMRPLYFGESGGHLHLVEDGGYKRRLHLNVYEMLSDYSGWVVKYRVQADELPVCYRDMVYSNGDLSNYLIEVFDVIRGEEEEEEERSFVVVRIPGKMIRYNVGEKRFEEIMDLPSLL